MYDIHCHVLPGVDDGPSDVEESLDMCRTAAYEGVKIIAATPHYIFRNKYSTQSGLLSRIFLLNRELMDEGIELTVIPGMEVSLIPDLPELCSQGMIMTLNLKKYLLLELPMNGNLPIYMYDVLFRLQVKGIKPVIAHPERCEHIMKDPNLVYSLIDRGCLIQMNADSIKGMFGRRVKKTALKLLKHNMVHVIASDNHSLHGRMSSLKESYNTILKMFGKELAENLFIHNPGKIINGQDIFIGQPIKIKKVFW